MAKLTFAWPFGYDDFAAAPAEGAWLLQVSAPVALDGQFAAAAAPWTETYWTPAEMAFNGAGAPPVGGEVPRRLLMGVGT
jgi:hypothetical protein